MARGELGSARPPRVERVEVDPARAWWVERGGAGVAAAARAERGDRDDASERRPRAEREDRDDAAPERRPRAERGDRGQPPAVDWVARFSDELLAIARGEASGPSPVVAHSDAVPNVGTNGAVVLVNTRWMQGVSDEICGDRAGCQQELVRGIAGHEWSHVLDVRRGDVASGLDHAKELQADRTAGRILAQSGASVRPLLELLGGDRSGPSLTHPSGGERVEAVLAGQQQAQRACRGEGTCRCCDGGEDERMAGSRVT